MQVANALDIKITIQYQIYSTSLTTKLGEGNEHV